VVFLADEWRAAGIAICFDARRIHREFGEPFGVAVNGSDIYVSDGDAGKIWVLHNGSPTIFAEGFGTPSAIAFNKNGDLIVADSGSHTINLVNAKGRGIGRCGNRRARQVLQMGMLLIPCSTLRSVLLSPEGRQSFCRRYL
jgi:hypothetical protein